MRLSLRCEHKLHGILDAEEPSGIFEVRCDSQLCGKRPGVIVLHTIDLQTSKVETKFFKQPPTMKGV